MAKANKAAQSYNLHKELKGPVSNLVGYTILFLVALVLFMLVKTKLLF